MSPSQECHNVPERSATPPSPPVSEPPPPPQPPQREGRSGLKRVPSERFQKMRRKVQRLMSRRSDDVTDTAPLEVAVDEASYLQSIRIPDPGLTRKDW